MLDVVGMVIHHVENHPDARLVEALHHLFEFTDTRFRLVGIGGVAALGNVVVHGVVAPVVLPFVETRLIDRAEVVAGQDVDGIHAELFQMVDGPGLCEREELAGIFRVLSGDGEVTVVHLVDDEVGRRLHDRSPVLRPAFRVSAPEVDDGAALAVHTHRLGEDTGALAASDVKGVELPHQVALHRCRPQVVTHL